MREEEVYIYTKEWLKFNDFKIIAGQPPKGSDNIPVVEIKSLNNLDKGSKDVFKPDLIAINSKNLLIIECKPIHDLKDEKKLEKIMFDDRRKELFYTELNQRKLILNSGFLHYFNSKNLFLNKLKFCLANTSSTKMKNINNIKINKKILNSKLISSFNELNKIN